MICDWDRKTNPRNVEWRIHKKFIRDMYYSLTGKRFRSEFSNCKRSSVYFKTEGFDEESKIAYIVNL